MLRPGGVARFGVPKLEAAWDLNLRGEKVRMPHSFAFVTGAMGLSQHHYTYDFEILPRVLVDAGPVDVPRAKFGEGAVRDLEHLDDRQDHARVVGARRPLPQEMLAR